MVVAFPSADQKILGAVGDIALGLHVASQWNIDFDNPDLWLTGPQEGAEALENDQVVIDERDPDGFRHGLTLREGVRSENHPFG